MAADEQAADGGRGHVEPGGPPLWTEVGDGLELGKLSVGGMDNNAYLLVPVGRPAVLVDAAAEPERLARFIGDRGLDLIVTTHRHHDHLGALAELARRTGADLVAGEPDVEAIAEAAGVRPREVWTGDALPLGDGRLGVIGVRGHTPGSIVLVITPEDDRPVHLITGDSLFPGGPGRTSGPEEFGVLMADLTELIFGAYSDDTVVHPGHGDDTTLGAERPQLEAWRARGW